MLIDKTYSKAFGQNGFFGFFRIKFLGVILQDFLLPGYVNIWTVKTTRINRKTVIHVGFQLSVLFISQTVGLAITIEPMLDVS